MIPAKIAFVDVETTGGSIRRDRIIEIGVVRVENKKVVDKFQTLVNPETYVPPEIESLTGISSRELENAPVFSAVKNNLLEILEDCVFSAHNVRFDYSFIKSEFAREEINYKARNLCTVKLSRALFPKYRGHNLDEIISRFGIPCPNRHRAFDDAMVIWKFYQGLFKLFPEATMAEAVGKVMKRPSRPINLSEKILDDLPETPGVYVFYNKEGLPLYIGKSVNIHDRVLSHFAADHNSPTEQKIAQQVYSVETFPTTGEMGALFKESQMVKKFQPLYNRQLRNARQMVVAKLVKDPYHRVTLEETTTIIPEELETILGVFKSRSQAKKVLIDICKANNLCEKLLGLETGKGPCFGYHLKQCKGACIGEESPAIYNARLQIAFLKMKLKRWPFDGPVAIVEKVDDTHIEQHIIDNWCYLGTKRSADDEITRETKFDLDTYKILNRFLNRPGVKVVPFGD